MRGCVVVVRLLAGYGSGRGAVLANLGARVVGRAMKLEKASRSWLFFQRSRRRAAALGFFLAALEKASVQVHGAICEFITPFIKLKG